MLHNEIFLRFSTFQHYRPAIHIPILLQYLLCQDKTMHLLFLYDFKTLFLKMKINNIVLLCVFLYFFLSKFYIIFQ